MKNLIKLWRETDFSFDFHNNWTEEDSQGLYILLDVSGMRVLERGICSTSTGKKSDYLTHQIGITILNFVFSISAIREVS